MSNRRQLIPKSVRDALLNEFNHRCAMCGGDRPQIHHIDENPSNNTLDNLIPLCPNNHLLDSHNPTHPIEPDKLRLLRRFKDPMILSPSFDPLFRRARFLLQLRDVPLDVEVTEAQIAELVAFVRALVMGDFYASRLSELLSRPANPRVWYTDTPDSEIQKHQELCEHEFRQKLLDSRDVARVETGTQLVLTTESKRGRS
jgi:hypothetical protein